MGSQALKCEQVVLDQVPGHQKMYRAEVVRHYMAATGNSKVVCFTCGNAATALRNVGLDVVEVGPLGALQTGTWWSPVEIARAWPGRFDATSGHLPVWMMRNVGVALRKGVRTGLPDFTQGTEYVVPCGSGETLVCLYLGFPDMRFVARYDDARLETTYNALAPLNSLVQRLAVRVVHAGVDFETVTVGGP